MGRWGKTWKLKRFCFKMSHWYIEVRRQVLFSSQCTQCPDTCDKCTQCPDTCDKCSQCPDTCDKCSQCPDTCDKCSHCSKADVNKTVICSRQAMMLDGCFWTLLWKWIETRDNRITRQVILERSVSLQMEPQGKIITFALCLYIFSCSKLSNGSLKQRCMWWKAKSTATQACGSSPTSPTFASLRPCWWLCWTLTLPPPASTECTS